MINKIYKSIGVLSLLLFSFYYTDRAVDIVRRNDPIMKEIKNVSKNYKVNPVNAYIENDNIISGVNGIKVDLNESYKRMKKVGGFYESMLIFNEVIPNTSILNNYDKFVVKGNQSRSEVSLIFKINDSDDLRNIYNILLEKETTATFFVDGKILEENMDLIYDIVSDGYEIENFGYNDQYNIDSFNWTNNLLFSLTNMNPKFCYSEFNNYDILNLCSKNNMYTVKPFVVNNYVFNTVKNNLSSGMIYSFNINEELLKEIRTTISYIKQKGYDIVTLNDIILENRILEK